MPKNHFTIKHAEQNTILNEYHPLKKIKTLISLNEYLLIYFFEVKLYIKRSAKQ